MNEYTVEIPLRANVLAGVDTSSGDGLPDDYDFGGVLRTRMGRGTSTPVWYLDFSNRKAESKSEAIRQALPTAVRFVKFIALTYNKGFEIDIASSKANRVDGELEISDYGHFASLPSNLDEIAILWNKYDNIDYEDEEGMKRQKLIDDALDWIYLGKTMRDQRNTLMAYVTALEILIDQGKDSPTLKTILSEEEYANLGK